MNIIMKKELPGYGLIAMLVILLIVLNSIGNKKTTQITLPEITTPAVNNTKVWNDYNPTAAKAKYANIVYPDWIAKDIIEGVQSLKYTKEVDDKVYDIMNPQTRMEAMEVPSTVAHVLAVKAVQGFDKNVVTGAGFKTQQDLYNTFAIEFEKVAYNESLSNAENSDTDRLIGISIKIFKRLLNEK